MWGGRNTRAGRVRERRGRGDGEAWAVRPTDCRSPGCTQAHADRRQPPRVGTTRGGHSAGDLWPLARIPPDGFARGAHAAVFPGARFAGPTISVLVRIRDQLCPER